MAARRKPPQSQLSEYSDVHVALAWDDPDNCSFEDGEVAPGIYLRVTMLDIEKAGCYPIEKDYRVGNFGMLADYLE